MSYNEQNMTNVPDPRLLNSLESRRAMAAKREDDVKRLPIASIEHIKTANGLRAMRVSQEYFSRDLAGKFSIGMGWGSGSMDAKTKDFAIRYEALMESEAEPLDPLPDGQVYELVHAVGLTLDITVKQADLSVKADVYSVAAATQLQLASANYSITVYASDPTVLRKLMPKDGDLTIESYMDLVNGIAEAKAEIAKAMSQDPPTLSPQPYYRPRKVLMGIDAELAATQSIGFAIRYLSKGYTIKDAGNDSEDAGLDSLLVRLVYKEYWPEVTEERDPPADVRRKAAEWLVDSHLLTDR